MWIVYSLLGWLAFNALFVAVLYVQKVWRPEIDRKKKLKIVFEGC